MRRITHHQLKNQCEIKIMAYGLSDKEIKDIVKLIRKMNQKRSHGKSPQLLYDMLFDELDNNLSQNPKHVRFRHNQFGNLA